MPTVAFQTLLGFGTSRKSIEYEQVRGAEDFDQKMLGLAQSTKYAEDL
jgi:hypothetical protein